MDKNKIFYLNSTFVSKELPTSEDVIDSIYIEGYANTTDLDRVRDVVTMEAWQGGISNYLKNPIILAYHEHDDPIGRMEDHRIDSKGLWIKARISAAAEETFNLIKDGVLSAFSVGFRVLDATYDSVTDIFVIKELELLEISVVSVPANQECIFSLSKSFDNEEDYKTFKKEFASKEEPAKELEDTQKAFTSNKKEINMDPKELQEMIAAATAKALEDADTKRKAEAAEAAAKAAEEAALQAKIEQVAKGLITTEATGAEKLLAEVEKRIEQAAEGQKNVLAGLEASIKEKAEELTRIQNSKMNFADKSASDASEYSDRETAYLLSRVTGKKIEDTRFGRSLLEKAGAHVASATWELEVSRNMESEIRRQLVVAPLLRNVNMQTNVMTIPVNPEAGDADWMQNTAICTTESAGAPKTHALKEITLNAYKVATREYMAYEEEEDALLVLLPIVRDAMVRRVARGLDKAFLIGAGTGTDPVKGLALYDATSVVAPTNTGVSSIANLRSLRKDLGVWGLNPQDVIYIVSTDIYYDLLDDTSFQTMDKVGPSATLLTGQIGMVGNSPVLVSSMFPTKAGGTTTATTNIGAIAVATGNFLAGSQRGLRFDTQDLVETQRKVLVASMRTGFTQISTVNGMGVSTLRWS